MKKHILFLVTVIILMTSCSNESIDSQNTNNSEFLMTNIYHDTIIDPIATYSYDNTNRVESMTWNNDLNTVVEFIYNDEGILSEVVESPVNFVAPVSILGYLKISFVYTDENNLIGFFQEYDENDVLSCQYNVEYVFDGNLIKSVRVNGNDCVLDGFTTYTHDAQGRLLFAEYDNNAGFNQIKRQEILQYENNEIPSSVSNSFGFSSSFYLKYFPKFYISTKHPKRLYWESMNSATGFVSQSGNVDFDYSYDNQGNTTSIQKSIVGSSNSSAVISFDYIEGN